MNRLLLLTALVLFPILTACGPSDEALDEAAENAVAAYRQTIAAQPTATLQPTYTPYPTQTAVPSATPLPTHTPLPTLAPLTTDVSDLFCNFGFCLRYPQDALLNLPLYTVSFLPEIVGDLNKIESGSYVWGDLERRIILIWQTTTWTPLEYVTNYVDDPDYTNIGPVTDRVINNIEVTFGTFESDNGYGLISAWRCGSRRFVLSIQNSKEDDTLSQLERIVGDFVCTDGQ
jgi:hypothetical protein